MTPARPWTAVLIGLLTAIVAWVGLDLWTNGGGSRPPISWAAPAGTLALMLAVIAAGLPVRRWVRAGQDGRSDAQRRRVDPLVAARTAVLAKAAAYGGAVLFGWYLAQAGVLVPDLVGSQRRELVIALVTVGAAVLLVVAGFVVQHWCRVPPDDPGGDLQGADPDSDSMR